MKFTHAFYRVKSYISERKSQESIPKLFYGKRNRVQCITLIEPFPSWKQKFFHPN